MTWISEPDEGFRAHGTALSVPRSRGDEVPLGRGIMLKMPTHREENMTQRTILHTSIAGLALAACWAAENRVRYS